MSLRSALHILAVIVALGAMAVPARAQQLVPVDQGVGDIDPLARSLRHVDVGMGVDGQQAALYQIVPSRGAPSAVGFGMVPMYYRIGQGYRATLSRMDYMVRQRDGTWGYDMAPRKDRQFLEIIPPNTVFDLRPFNPQLRIGALYQTNAPATQPAAAANAAQHTATPVPARRIEPTRADNRIEAVRLSPTPAQH